MNDFNMYKSDLYVTKSKVLHGRMFLQLANRKCFTGSIEVLDGCAVINDDKGEYVVAIFEPAVFMQCMPKEGKDIILNSYIRN